MAEIARRRRHETALLFATLHNLLALIAAGDLFSAEELVAAIGHMAAHGSGDQARVAACIGLPLAGALVGLDGRGAEWIAKGLVHLGGSHAQRDVFARSLALLAARKGDGKTVSAILETRLKREDRFEARLTTLARKPRLFAPVSLTKTTKAA